MAASRVASALAVLLLVMAARVPHAQPTVTQTADFPAPEAGQGVAVDGRFFYAIDDRSIAKYDKQTGAEVGAVLMPAAQSGSPMTYSVDGRQFIVVRVSGGNYSGEFLSFALPQTELRQTQQGR